MKKAIFGIILIIIGLSLLGFSIYIKSEIKHGKEQLAEAKDKIEMGKRILSLTPVTKEIGKGFQGVIQSKINAAVVLIKKYTFIAWIINIIGIGFIVLGIILLFLQKYKK